MRSTRERADEEAMLERMADEELGRARLYGSECVALMRYPATHRMHCAHCLYWRARLAARAAARYLTLTQED